MPRISPFNFVLLLGAAAVRNDNVDDVSFYALQNSSVAQRLLLDLGDAVPKDGKYRLYYAANCPFAHRARMVRTLNGLEDAVLVYGSAVTQATKGYFFDPADPEFQKNWLRDIYLEADPKHEGKANVPMLLDRDTKSLVNHESIDIALAFSRLTGASNPLLGDNSEEDMVALMNELSAKVTLPPYQFIFSPIEAKDKVQADFFTELAKWEEVLSKQKYVLGEQISLADCVLWPSLLRFDNVYARQFFRTEKSIMNDFPNLQAYLNRAVDSYPSLLVDLDMPTIIKLYWQSGILAPKAGNDPEATVPAVIDIFGGKLASL